MIPELIHPLHGEVINQDTDSLIRCHDDLLTTEHAMAAFRHEIARQLAARAATTIADPDGKSRTFYLRGEKLRCRIEVPGDSWNQAILKEAYIQYPKYREKFLRIATLAINIREYKKSETGPADFVAFKSLLSTANRGPMGTPRITMLEE